MEYCELNIYKIDGQVSLFLMNPLKNQILVKGRSYI